MVPNFETLDSKGAQLARVYGKSSHLKKEGADHISVGLRHNPQLGFSAS